MNCEEYKKYCIGLVQEHKLKTLSFLKGKAKKQFPNFEVIIFTRDDNFYAKICEFEFIVDVGSFIIFLDLPHNHDYLRTGPIHDEYTLGQFFAANERLSGEVIHKPESSWWKFWK